MTGQSQTRDKRTKTTREVVATFFDAGALEQAVTALKAAGFGKNEISAVAGAHTVKEALSGHYQESDEQSGEPGAPKTAFVGRESVGDAVHAILGAFYFTGATVAAGALLATVGALASPVVTAVAAAVAVGGIGALTVQQIGKNEAEYLQEEIDRGHLLLFVRTANPARERQASEILKQHAGFEPHVLEIGVAAGS